MGPLEEPRGLSFEHEGLADAAVRIAQAERRFGVAFQDRRLLLQALLHRSYVLEREREGRPALALASNERLEFLGDAVLSMLIAQYAFHTFPDYDEGRLTEVRSALVRRSTLAMLAEGLGLSDLLYMGRAEQRRGGRGHATVLAEAFEAVLAAIFLDQGLARAETFLADQLRDRIDAFLERAGGLNAKSRLQEYAQAELRLIPHYTLLERRGPAHDSRFDVEARAGEHTATGTGTSIQAAEQDAARILLGRLTEATSISSGQLSPAPELAQEDER
ncbi:MAG TPA: ribonuclease III [Chloroflexota bacterium]|nr:ribonuclease III [Chloroflexota bacterium]